MVPGMSAIVTITGICMMFTIGLETIPGMLVVVRLGPGIVGGLILIRTEPGVMIRATVAAAVLVLLTMTTRVTRQRDLRCGSDFPPPRHIQKSKKVELLLTLFYRLRFLMCLLYLHPE
uniref:Uncharacterized protein n=1 Tax=Cacopsylla melanoneura TaxID=428564 RepID=A0A8D8LST7_9HEMI